jgi:hypothetical protein
MPDYERPQPLTEIHPTKSFFNDLDTLAEASGPAGDQLVLFCVAAIGRLQREDLGLLPLKSYGVVGDSYIYKFAETHSFTFRVHTDRDGDGHPLKVHYYLKRILLNK